VREVVLNPANTKASTINAVILAVVTYADWDELW